MTEQPSPASRPAKRPVLAAVLLVLGAAVAGLLVLLAPRPQTAPDAPAASVGAALTPASQRPAAPGFTLQAVDGRRFTLEEHRGRVVVLFFTGPG